MLTAPDVRTGDAGTTRRLTMLLRHLEDGLRDASFHLARRDLHVLSDLLQSQARVQEAAIALFKTVSRKEHAARFARQFEDIRKAHESLMANAAVVRSDISNELSALRRASAQIQHVRRSASGSGDADRTERIHVWA